MSFQFRDTISPTLARQARAIKDRRPILEAMGAEFTSLTKRAFADAALRPATWPPLKPATLARKKGSMLRESGALWHSIRITALTSSSVTVGSDRVYAAIQQLGGEIKRGQVVIRIPARPYMPILGGKITPAARQKIEAVAKRKIELLLR